MRYLTVQQLTNKLGGTFNGDDRVLKENVIDIVDTLDKLKNGSVYLPRWLNSSLLVERYQKLAEKPEGLCYVIDSEIFSKIEEPQESTSYILVDTYLDAVLRLISYLRQQIAEPIISITGSVGKTSTTGMVASVLSQQLRALKTTYYQNIPRNYHEPLYRMYRGGYDVGVFEAAELPVASVKPEEEYVDFVANIAVATNVGEAHLDQFLTQESIFESVQKTIKLVPSSGHCYVDGCDEYLQTLTADKSLQVRMYGMNPELEYHPENITNLGLKGINCDLVHENQRLNVTIPVPGAHFINSALVSFAIGMDFGVSYENIKKGIESYETSKLRSKVYETGYVSIIQDTYNSSPKSVKAAVDTLSGLEGRRVLIWGDMLALGERTEQLHKQTLEYIIKSEIDVLISVGVRGVDDVHDAASVRAGEIIMQAVELVPQDSLWFMRVADAIELRDILPSIIKRGDTIFLKCAHAAAEQFHQLVVILQDLGDEIRFKKQRQYIEELERKNKWLLGRKVYYMNRLETVKERNETLKAQTKKLTRRNDTLESRIKNVVERKEYYLERYDIVKLRNKTLEGRLQRTEERKERLAQQNKEFANQIAQIKRSNSWKITAPLRRLARFLGRNS